jgi:hypothetical protein
MFSLSLPSCFILSSHAGIKNKWLGPKEDVRRAIKIWNTIVDELWESDLISEAHQKQLKMQDVIPDEVHIEAASCAVLSVATKTFLTLVPGMDHRAACPRGTGTPGVLLQQPQHEDPGCALPRRDPFRLNPHPVL